MAILKIVSVHFLKYFVFILLQIFLTSTLKEMRISIDRLKGAFVPKRHLSDKISLKNKEPT